MKIVAIGPANSGKTVLFAMLDKYISLHECQITLRELDAETSDYLGMQREILGKGKWPGATSSNVIHLRWKITESEAEHDLAMQDVDGKQLVEILKERGESRFAGFVKWLRKQIDKSQRNVADSPLKQLRDELDSSDAMLFLLDLERFLKTENEKVQSEGRYLLNEFLNRERWKGKKKAILVTKADSFQEFNSTNGTDIRARLVIMLANRPELRSVVEAAKAHFIPVSSVVTKRDETLPGSGQLIELPATPLRPGNMEPLVTHLTALLRNYRETRRVWTIAAAMLGCCVLLTSGILWWREHMATQSLQIRFLTHKNDGRTKKGDGDDGNKRNVEGTDATISLYVNGAEGDAVFEFDGSSSAQDDKGNMDPFEDGKTDVFNRMLEHRIGVIKSIRVKNHDGPQRGGWCLDDVTIDDLRNGKKVHTYRFAINTWLANEPRGDPPYHLEITKAPEPDL